MASTTSWFLTICFLLVSLNQCLILSSAEELPTEALGLPSTLPAYDEFGDGQGDWLDLDDGGDEDEARRSLLWHASRYYISYGALSANRIPCPPRSGRSYYTHNCFKARGPVRPYHRGCSRITLCRY